MYRLALNRCSKGGKVNVLQCDLRATSRASRQGMTRMRGAGLEPVVEKLSRSRQERLVLLHPGAVS